VKENVILYSTSLIDSLPKNDPRLTLFATHFYDKVEKLLELANLIDATKIIFSISTYEQTYMTLKKPVEVIMETIRSTILFEMGDIFVHGGRAILSKDGEYTGLERMMITSKGIRLTNMIKDLSNQYNILWVGIEDEIDCFEIKEMMDKRIDIPYNIFVSDTTLIDENRIFYSSSLPGIKGRNEALGNYINDVREKKTPKKSSFNAIEYSRDLDSVKRSISELSEIIETIKGHMKLDHEDLQAFVILKEKISVLLDKYQNNNQLKIRGLLFEALSRLKHIENFAKVMGYFKK
jgi:hypothetical protein